MTACFVGSYPSMRGWIRPSLHPFHFTIHSEQLLSGTFSNDWFWHKAELRHTLRTFNFSPNGLHGVEIDRDT